MAFARRAGAAAPVDPSFDERKRLRSRIACPVPLIDGAESHLRDTDPDRGTGYVADARAITIADAGHWVRHDQPAPFEEAVRTFLA